MTQRKDYELSGQYDDFHFTCSNSKLDAYAPELFPLDLDSQYVDYLKTLDGFAKAPKQSYDYGQPSAPSAPPEKLYPDLSQYKTKKRAIQDLQTDFIAKIQPEGINDHELKNKWYKEKSNLVSSWQQKNPWFEVNTGTIDPNTEYKNFENNRNALERLRIKLEILKLQYEYTLKTEQYIAKKADKVKSKYREEVIKEHYCYYRSRDDLSDLILLNWLSNTSHTHNHYHYNSSYGGGSSFSAPNFISGSSNSDSDAIAWLILIVILIILAVVIGVSVWAFSKLWDKAGEEKIKYSSAIIKTNMIFSAAIGAVLGVGVAALSLQALYFGLLSSLSFTTPAGMLLLLGLMSVGACFLIGGIIGFGFGKILKYLNPNEIAYSRLTKKFDKEIAEKNAMLKDLKNILHDEKKQPQSIRNLSGPELQIANATNQLFEHKQPICNAYGSRPSHSFSRQVDTYSYGSSHRPPSTSPEVG